MKRVPLAGSELADSKERLMADQKAGLELEEEMTPVTHQHVGLVLEEKEPVAHQHAGLVLEEGEKS